MIKKTIYACVFVVFTFGSWYVLKNYRLKEEKLKEVLFIGNSYTYRNKGVDQHLGELVLNSNESSFNLHFNRAAQGKFHLHTHFKNSNTLAKFGEKQWDEVVLQEYSTGSVKEKKSFFHYGKKWAIKIRNINPKAKIYLYATWGYKKDITMTDSVFNSYDKLAKEINATVVPVGKLWAKVQKITNLYDGDGAHPNRKGTFLTSCLFYEVMTRKNVLKTKDTDLKLPKYLQRKLKKYAHQFYINYKKNNG